MEFTVNGHAIQEYAFCACDCNNRVNSPKSMFRPGHDQKLVSRLATKMVEAKVMNDDMASFRLGQIVKSYSGALQGKIWSKFDNDWSKISKRVARKAHVHQVAALDDLITALDAISVPSTVKVGRWDYPTKLSNRGQIFRNTKRDGSGEWVFHSKAA